MTRRRWSITTQCRFKLAQRLNRPGAQEADWLRDLRMFQQVVSHCFPNDHVHMRPLSFCWLRDGAGGLTAKALHGCSGLVAECVLLSEEGSWGKCDEGEV